MTTFSSVQKRKDDVRSFFNLTTRGRGLRVSQMEGVNEGSEKNRSGKSKERCLTRVHQKIRRREKFRCHRE